MTIDDLSARSLEPFDNLGLIRNYFAAVKAMDSASVEGREFDVGEIMSLWHRDGKLAISGKDTVGEHQFDGEEEIASFYRNRAKGADGTFRVNLSKIDVANAKNSAHVVASGVRYIVTRDEQGLQAPFTHNFDITDGRISALRIHVGAPGPTEVAPPGNLRVEDMGRLSAMAWMVA